MASITRTARSDWKTTKARCIDKAAIITDLWDIVKAWLGHFAVIILFLCMVGDILQVLPVDIMSVGWKAFILGVQIVTIDIAGFGLQTMAENAHTNGDIQGYKAATRTSRVLIGIMIVTLLLLTMGLIWHDLMPFVNASNDVLILVRVVMTVLYGHIVHSLSKTHQPTITPSIVASYETQLEAMRQQLAHQEQHYHVTITRIETETHTRITLLEKQLETNIMRMLPRGDTHVVDTSNNLVENVFDTPKRLLEKVVEDENVVGNVFDMPEKVVEKVVAADGLYQGDKPTTSLVEKDEKVVETLSSDEVNRVLEAYKSGIVKSKLCAHLHIGTGKYKAIGKVVDDYEKSNKVVEKV